MAPVQGDRSSLLHIERISQYVSLSPASLNSPLPAICASVFSPLLLSYFPPARGIVLAYEDVALSSTPPAKSPEAISKKASSKSKSKHRSEAVQELQQTQQQQDDEPMLLRHVDEYFAPFIWATASFLVFRPKQNAYITGRITHQSKTHITLAYLNTFPVSIIQDHLPAGWTWHSESAGKVKKGWDGRLQDEGGWWVDADGNTVGGDLEVRIRDFDGRMDGKGKGKGFLRIEGSLLSMEEEKAKVAARREKGKGKIGGMRSQQTPAQVDVDESD